MMLSTVNPDFGPIVPAVIKSKNNGLPDKYNIRTGAIYSFCSRRVVIDWVAGSKEVGGC
jgi:hypothetical protein